MLSTGSITQARELLEQTLKSHPDAVAARTLLKETVARAQPAFAGAGIAALPTIPVPSPDLGGPDAATFVRAPSSPLPSAADEPTFVRAPSSPASSAAGAATFVRPPAPAVGAPSPAAPPLPDIPANRGRDVSPSPLLPPPPAMPDVPANRGRAQSPSRRMSIQTIGLITTGVVFVLAAGGVRMITKNRQEQAQTQPQPQTQSQAQAPSHTQTQAQPPSQTAVVSTAASQPPTGA